MWREISKEIAPLIPEIWEREQALPLWFQAARSTWTGTLEDFTDFVLKDCWSVQGWYVDGDLKALVYIERANNILSIHLSVLDKIDMDEFAIACAELRDQHFHEGAIAIRGWVLGKNLALIKMLNHIGFRNTGLQLDRGMSRGTVLRWKLLEVRSA